jgi:hypothetical protein
MAKIRNKKEVCSTMRLLKMLAVIAVTVVSLPIVLAASQRTLDEVIACSQKDDAIREYPAACYVALVLKKIDGKSPAEALTIVEEEAKRIPSAATLAKSALSNIADRLRTKILQDARDSLVKSPKEAEDFLDECTKGDEANCAAATARLLEYAGVGLLEPALNVEALLKVLGGAKVDVSEVARGANEDIQLAAGYALWNVLNDVRVGFPEGCIKYGKIPGAPGDEEGLIVSGKTAYARAACSDVAVGKTLDDWIPPRGIDAPKIRAIYARLTDAETKGKMELAYMLARVYLFLFKASLVGRGVAEAIRLSDECLLGKDIVLDGSPFECSKYKSLRLAMATEFQAGFFRFFGHLAEIACEDLLKRAETGTTPGIRLAAARAYVSGQVVPPGIERKCLEPYTKASLLKLIREAKSAELRAEAAGDVWMVFNDGKAIGVYSGPRGLAALLLETGDADEKLLDDPLPEVRHAAWLAVGKLSWANSKRRAANWGEATTGKTEARKRAGAFAYFFPRGLDQFRTLMEPLAQGDKASVDKYTLDGTKAPVRVGAGLEAVPVLVQRPEAELEKCADTGATPELKDICMKALAQALANKPIGDLIKQTAAESAGRSKAAGLALAPALIGPPGLAEQEIRNIINQYPSGVPRTDGFPVKEPLTAALVEAFGTRIKESIK